MKPFDLEAAKAGVPFIYRHHLDEDEIKIKRSGQVSVKFIGVRANGSIVYELENGEITWAPESELRMLPAKRTVYVNLHAAYLGDSRGRIARWFDSISEAQQEAATIVPPKFVAVPVEIED